jgi:hypothetical protein
MQECLIQVEAQQDDPLDKAMKAASHDANVNPDDGLHPPPSLFAQEMLTQLNTLKTTMVNSTAQDGKSTRPHGVTASPA